MAVRGLGCPVRFTLTAGQKGDAPQAAALIEGLPAEVIMADTAYDADHLRQAIAAKGALAVIPNNPSRALKYPLDMHLYAQRHLVECCFSKLKQFRRVATRFEKTAEITVPSSLSQPSSYGCDKCPHYLALPERDGRFDMMLMLIHHLTSTDWRLSWENARLALDEAWRVLKPGGRLLIVESCIPWSFFHFEKPAPWLLSRSIKSIFSHPVTLQFPASMIKAELEKKISKVKITEIPKGKFVLQFGFKVPSFLTPAVPFAFDAIKK
jgi:transposase